MKLLIIAGPYEADRIRRAAVVGGFEAVAIEPGESLSGWITATRPDVIILAPQIISAQASVALAKVRAVPRGRVPIFLVGDAEDQEHLKGLGDGFFVRPVAADDLLSRAREAVRQEQSPAGDSPARTAARSKTAEYGSPRPPTLRPLVAAREISVPGGAAPSPGASDPPPSTAVPVPLKTAERWPPPLAPTSTIEAAIEADIDADLRDAVRAVEIMRQQQLTESSQPIPGAVADPARDQRGVGAASAVVSPEAIDADSEWGLPAPAPLPRAPQTGEVNETELDLPSLLARMYLSQLSGRLTVTHGMSVKHIFFERGHPVLARSAQTADRMGDMLVRHGRFTAAQIAACGAEVASTGKRMGTVLIERGLLKPAELATLVRWHHEDIIYSLFAWEHGAWTLSSDSSSRGEDIRLTQHPAALIVEGIRRKYSATRALAALGGAGRILRLRLTTGASDLLENMGLGTDERNLVLLFDGVSSLEQIRKLTKAPAARLYRVAWALLALERLDPVNEAAAIGRGGDALVVGGGEQVDRERARVRDRHALALEGDYFQILAVARDADGEEIARAARRTMAEFADDAVPPAVRVAYQAELREIRALVSEATRLLADEALRRQYREHLPAPRAMPANSLQSTAP